MPGSGKNGRFLHYNQLELIFSGINLSSGIEFQKRIRSPFGTYYSDREKFNLRTSVMLSVLCGRHKAAHNLYVCRSLKFRFFQYPDSFTADFDQAFFLEISKCPVQ